MPDKNIDGFITFGYGKEGVIFYEENKPKVFNYSKEDNYSRHICGDLYDGLEFLELVRSEEITNYDGHIGDVYINNKLSNLGLITNNGFIGGRGFLITEEVWEEFYRDKGKIEVEWCNK